VLELVHGKPMRFGKDNEKGIVLGRDMRPRVVDVDSSNEADILVHDETSEVCALLLSRFTAPEFPVPIGVFRAVQRPSYDKLMNDQVEKARASRQQSVQDLLNENQWTVK
jgi:2-oxoglutarate ferredoxin oxidoreductase subunit beta